MEIQKDLHDFSYLDTAPAVSVPGYNDTLPNFTPTYNDMSVKSATLAQIDALKNFQLGLSKPNFGKGDTLDQIYKDNTSKKRIDNGFISVNETHSKLSDGSYTPNYENYIKGTDNELRLRAGQSTMERFLNPVGKFGTKVARGIPMDLAGFAYGIGDAILSGRLDSLYNNDFVNYIDDLDKKTDNKYTNYYLKGEDDLLNPMYTWDKVLGGAEFTVRMMGGEALLAMTGVGTPMAFGSWTNKLSRLAIRGMGKTGKIDDAIEMAGKLAKGADSIQEVGKRNSKILKFINKPVSDSAKKGVNFSSNVRQASNVIDASNDAFKVGFLDGKKLLDTGRFLLTSTAHEAGFEARHFEAEAENEFWQYHRANGTKPTDEELTKFYETLNGQAGNVFAANLAILGVSNLAMFGNMFNIKNPFGKMKSSSFINGFKNGTDKTLSAKIFGLGVGKNEKGLYEALKASKLQKGLNVGSKLGKGMLTEGVWEEGGQGIASTTMKNYVQASYDPKAKLDNATYFDAFANALNHQFTSKEGIEEMVIGGIIGGLFSARSIPGEVRSEYAGEQIKADVYNKIKPTAEMMYTSANLASALTHASRVQNISKGLQEALDNNEVVTPNMKYAESLISLLDQANSVGKSGETIDIMADILEGASLSDVAQILDINEAQAEEFRDIQLKGLRNIKSTYESAVEFAENQLNGLDSKFEKGDISNMKSAIAYAVTMGSVSEGIASNLFERYRESVRDYLGEDAYSDTRALEAMFKLEATELNNLEELESERARLEALSVELGVELSNLGVNNSEEGAKRDVATKQKELSERIQDITNELTEVRNNHELLKSSLASKYHKLAGEGAPLSKEDFQDFQAKVNRMQKAMENMQDRAGARDMINTLNEFSIANAYHKGFLDIVNGFSNPELQYKTYRGFLGNYRTKGQSFNEFTENFFRDLANSNIAWSKYYNNDVNTELESYKPGDKPSKALTHFVETKQRLGKELTEQEQAVLDYEKSVEDKLREAKERKERIEKLKKYRDRLSPINSDLESKAKTKEEIIKEKLEELKKIEAEFQAKLDELKAKGLETIQYEMKVEQMDLENFTEDDIKSVKTYEVTNEDGSTFVTQVAEFNNGVLVEVSEKNVTPFKFGETIEEHFDNKPMERKNVSLKSTKEIVHDLNSFPFTMERGKTFDYIEEEGKEYLSAVNAVKESKEGDVLEVGHKNGSIKMYVENGLLVPLEDKDKADKSENISDRKRKYLPSIIDKNDSYLYFNKIGKSNKLANPTTFNIVENNEVSDKENIKNEIKNKINSLSDDYVYHVHQTYEDTAESIYNTSFKLQGPAVESTFLTMSKDTMIQVFSNMVDGITMHHGAKGAYIFAIPKSYYGNQKLIASNSFDALMENGMLSEDLNIDPSLTIGYFANNVVTLKNEIKEEQATLVKTSTFEVNRSKEEGYKKSDEIKGIVEVFEYSKLTPNTPGGGTKIVSSRNQEIVKNGNVTYATVAKNDNHDLGEDGIYIKDNTFYVIDGMGGESSYLNNGTTSIDFVIGEIEGIPHNNIELEYYRDALRMLKDEGKEFSDVFDYLSRKRYNKPYSELSVYLKRVIRDFTTETVGDNVSRSKRVGAVSVGATKIGDNKYEITHNGDSVYFVIGSDNSIKKIHGLSENNSTDGYVFKSDFKNNSTTVIKPDTITKEVITLQEGESLVLATDFLEKESDVLDFIKENRGDSIVLDDFTKSHKFDDASFIRIDYIKESKNDVVKNEITKKDLVKAMESLKKSGLITKMCI